MRLNRFLAQCGAASRRSAEALILEGVVTINGVVTRELATQVNPARDRVRLRGRDIKLPAQAVYLMLNKPPGYDVTRHDPHARRTIFDLLPRDLPDSVQAVGRLDRDTTGLLILTSDGELGFRLAHPSHGVEKEYQAYGNDRPTDEQIQTLLKGVELEDGHARALKVQRCSSHPGEPQGLRLAVVLGRKRIVRRMCEEVGFPLTRLHRSRFGPLVLGNLAERKSRPLTEHEIKALKKAAGLDVMSEKRR